MIGRPIRQLGPWILRAPDRNNGTPKPVEAGGSGIMRDFDPVFETDAGGRSSAADSQRRRMMYLVICKGERRRPAPNRDLTSALSDAKDSDVVPNLIPDGDVRGGGPSIL